MHEIRQKKVRQPVFLESLGSLDGKLVRIKPFYKTSLVVVVVVVVVVVQGLPSFDDINNSDFHGSKLGPLFPHSGLPAAFNPTRVQ